MAYIIKSGDTLGQLAIANKTDVATIQKLNPNITDPNKTFAGQSLNLPQAPVAPVSTFTPVTNAASTTPIVATSDLARNNFNNNVNTILPKMESQYNTDTQMRDPVTGQVFDKPIAPTKAGETPIPPAIPPALSYKSDNPAFQNIVDQANNLLKTAKESGVAITPEIQQQINNINNFNTQKTAAVAEARTAADNKDAAGTNTAIKTAKTADTSAIDEIKALMEQLKTTRADYKASLAPTDKEIQLKTDLQKLRTDRQLLPLELRQEGISSAGISGRQVDDERVRAIQESNLLFEIGLEQDARTYKTSAIEKQMGFIKDNADLQLKIQDILGKKEKEITDNARTLAKDSLSVLSDIVKTFEGLAWSDLDIKTQQALLEKAKQFNIPTSLLQSALETSKQQQIYDRSIKAKDKTTEVEKKQNMLSQASQAFEAVKGMDNYINPVDWVKLRAVWLQRGGLLKDFTDNFSIYQNPNDTYN